MTRQDGRTYDELRPMKITTDFVKFAEGEGWVTAEYSMPPRANRELLKIQKEALGGTL